MVRNVENLERGNGGHAEISKEFLARSRFEVRFANVDNERDINAVTGLFDGQTIIEHLSGIAPAVTPTDIDVKAYARKRPEYNILIATKEGIQNHYRERPHSHLIVAEDKTTKEIVGTVTVDAPAGSGLGLLCGSIARIAVADSVRGGGVGRMLLRSAKAFVLSKKNEGGLECPAAQAGIILGIQGKDIPLNLFESEGFENKGDFHGQCVSWSNDIKKFVLRDVRIVRKEAQAPLKRTEQKIDVSEIPHKSS